MQREIKFRAWLNNKPLGLSGYSLSKDGALIPAHPGIVIEQYTGLKDKNGREVYEGDIYIMGDMNIKYIVEWIDCGLKGRQSGNKSTAGIDHWRSNIVVIGTIHENPELLEGK